MYSLFRRLVHATMLDPTMEGCICSARQPGTVPLPPPAPAPRALPLAPGQLPLPPPVPFSAPPARQFLDSILAVSRATIPDQSECWSRACDWLAAPGAGPDLPPSIYKNLARKAGPWSAPPLISAGLERGQTRARNHSIPAPPPRSPPPLCAGAQLLPPRPREEREAGNGRRCLPEPSPGARLAERRVPLRPADLSVHLTVGADGS